LFSQSKRHLRDIHSTGLSQSVVFPARNPNTLRAKARLRNPFPPSRTFLSFSAKWPFPVPKPRNFNFFNVVEKNQGGFRGRSWQRKRAKKLGAVALKNVTMEKRV